KAGHEVPASGFGISGEVACLERHILQSLFVRLRQSELDGIGAEVIADEAAPLITPGHGDKRRATATARIHASDSSNDPPSEFRCKRQDVVEQARSYRLATILGHDLVEAGVIVVAGPASGLEVADRLVLDLAEERNMLGINREIAERSTLGETGGMFRR